MSSKRQMITFKDVDCILGCGCHKKLTLKMRYADRLTFTKLEDIGLKEYDTYCESCGLLPDEFDIPEQELVGTIE